LGARRGGAWVAAAAAIALLLGGCGRGGSSGRPGPPANLGPESPPEARASVVIFDDALVHQAALQMAPEDWQSIVDDSRGDDWRPATFYLDGVVVANVGVRPSGESSRVPGNPKMSVRVQFDAYVADKKLGGLDSIKLSGSWDDPFVVRDRIAYWFMRQMMPAPREVAADLWVNGELKGAYEIEERWGRESLAGHYSPPFGPLYRLRGSLTADPYGYAGADPALYVPLPWDPIGTHPTDDNAVVPQALATLAQGPGSMQTAFDVDEVLNYFASDVLLSNTDGFTGPLEVDDHYEYFNPATGTFFMLPWDPDNTFGSINDSPSRDIFDNFGKSVLSRDLRDDPGLRELYFQKLEAFMAHVPLDALNAEIDRVYNQVHDSVERDALKQYPIEHFNWSLGYVKDFAAARYASVSSQIAAYRGGAPVPTGMGMGMGTGPTAGGVGP
jgi:hypothetical protein